MGSSAASPQRQMDQQKLAQQQQDCVYDKRSLHLGLKMKEKKQARRGVERRKRESKRLERIKKNDDVVLIGKGNNKK